MLSLFSLLHNISLDRTCFAQSLLFYPSHHSFPFPPPQATMILLSDSMRWTTLVISYEWSHMVSTFCDWHISLDVMALRYIHLVAYDQISFFSKAE